MTPDILFIAGFGRSGSTLIEAALQREFDVLGIGEAFFMWERGWLRNERTGAGVPFRDSAFWNRVLQRGFGDLTSARVETFASCFETLRGRRMQSGSLASQLPDLREFASIARPLYDALREEAQGRIIVDGSKYPLFGAALARSLDLKVGVVHVYRDPRAVAHSWATKRARGEGEGAHAYMARSRTPLSSAWRWWWFNRQAEDLCTHFDLPSVRIGYEAFCDDPSRYMRLVAERFSLGPKTLPDTDWPSVSGNPARLEGTLDRVRRDDRWMTDLARVPRVLTSAVCGRPYAALRGVDEAQFAPPPA